jgi:hypothetical protein
VVLEAGGAVDAAATARRRAEIGRPTRREGESIYALGEARLRYERRFSPEARRALEEILAALPILLRYRVKNDIHAAVAGEGSDAPLTAQDVRDAWAALRSRLYPERAPGRAAGSAPTRVANDLEGRTRV